MLEKYFPTILTMLILTAILYLLYRISNPVYEEDCEC